MLYPFLTFVMLVIAFCAQEFIPRLGPEAYHSLILLFPVWFLCSAVTVPFPTMLTMAFTSGLIWDLRHCVQAGEGASSDLELGISILFYGVLGTLMQGVRPLYLRGRWEFPIILIGSSIFVLRVMEYLILNFKRGSFQFPTMLFYEICITALLSMAISPLILFTLYWLSRTLHYRPAFERPTHF